MIKLYDNPFSPFARKVRIVLGFKGLTYESIDALALDELEGLSGVNTRAEVPVLVDDSITVVNPADIAAYLEQRYPTPAVYPANPADRVDARAWERLADSLFDAIIHDISLWVWPTHHREDAPPAELLEAGQRDLAKIVDRMEEALDGKDFLCGELSIADFAVFPHASSLRPLGFLPGADTHPHVNAWSKRVRKLPVVAHDLDYVKTAAQEKFGDAPSPYEGEKVIWRGDRLEWLFCNGLHDWWHEELRAGRAEVPPSI